MFVMLFIVNMSIIWDARKFYLDTISNIFDIFSNFAMQ